MLQNTKDTANYSKDKTVLSGMSVFTSDVLINYEENFCKTKISTVN